jgi:hypothetical protein
MNFKFLAGTFPHLSFATGNHPTEGCCAGRSSPCGGTSGMPSSDSCSVLANVEAYSVEARSAETVDEHGSSKPGVGESFRSGDGPGNYRVTRTAELPSAAEGKISRLEPQAVPLRPSGFNFLTTHQIVTLVHRIKQRLQEGDRVWP